MSTCRPSHTHWAKNPDYYVKGRPFPDRLERALVPEYATRLAQFKAGNIHTFVAANEDIVQAKKDVPKSLIYQDQLYNSMTSCAEHLVRLRRQLDLQGHRACARRCRWRSTARPSPTSIENIDKFASGRHRHRVAGSTRTCRRGGVILARPDRQVEVRPGREVPRVPSRRSRRRCFRRPATPTVSSSTSSTTPEATYGAAYASAPRDHPGILATSGCKGNLKGLPYAQWLANYHYGYIAGEVRVRRGQRLQRHRPRRPSARATRRHYRSSA